MIKLRKTEKIEIFQVELALKEKTKQSPFIAVLILARELGKIDAISLKENLLPTLPERACENLLKRLASQEYFYKKEYGNYSSYTLTELGEQSANDKSFWVGEKGIYNVYISHSNLLNQKIIKIEKIDRSEDDRNGNRITRTPHFISQYHNQILNLNKKEIRIEEIEDKCFQLNSLECSLEIEAKGDNALIRIKDKEKQNLYESSFEIKENDLKEELLKNTKEFNYDAIKKVVLSVFNQDNISFNRKVKVENPHFRDNHFNSVEIENVAFIPSDKQNAELWLNEILFKGIDKYFLDEKTFNEFISNKAKPILEHYKLKLPTRKELIQIFSKRQNSFYQTAKLETIDYLNY
jgi:hypothetical protein